MPVKRMPPIHPGVTLKQDFLEPLGMSMNCLAMELRVPVTRVSEIIHQRRSVTAETALRLGRFFGTSAQFWVNLQANYDLEVAEDKSRGQIEKQITPWRAA